MKNFQKVADGTHRNSFYSSISFFTDIIGKLLKKAVSSDSLKKIKNPAVFAPSQSNIPNTIIEDFYKNQTRFISLMGTVKNLDTNKIKIASPIGDLINLRMIDVFEITIMHERRHFNQAEEILEQEGFPT